MLVVRPAEPDDDRALAELDATSWPVEVQVVPPQSAAEPFFGQRRPMRDVLVAEYDGVIVGYVRLGRHIAIPANEHVMHIGALVVAAQARGAGVGGELVAKAVDEARRRGVVKLGLRVLSTNPTAIGVYERAGFEEEARLRGELRRPDGSYADDICLALWLNELSD